MRFRSWCSLLRLVQATNRRGCFMVVTHVLLCIRSPELGYAEVSSAEVGSAEVSSAEVRLYVSIVFSPYIPSIYVLLEKIKMLPFCHVDSLLLKEVFYAECF